MTQVGAGGVKITGWTFTRRFQRQYRKLTARYQRLCDQKLRDLLQDPMPPGLRFEKLTSNRKKKGYRKPDRYTIHLDGNYKLSMEISEGVAILRNVGTHNEIDRGP